MSMCIDMYKRTIKGKEVRAQEMMWTTSKSQHKTRPARGFRILSTFWVTPEPRSLQHPQKPALMEFGQWYGETFQVSLVARKPLPSSIMVVSSQAAPGAAYTNSSTNIWLTTCQPQVRGRRWGGKGATTNIISSLKMKKFGNLSALS